MLKFQFTVTLKTAKEAEKKVLRDLLSHSRNKRVTVTFVFSIEQFMFFFRFLQDRFYKFYSLSLPCVKAFIRTRRRTKLEHD